MGTNSPRDESPLSPPYSAKAVPVTGAKQAGRASEDAPNTMTAILNWETGLKPPSVSQR